MKQRKPLPAGYLGPPPHPAPYDHSRFRIAEEMAGTDLHQLWRLTYCLECREATWTHNHNPRTKDQMLCESCAYLMLESYTTDRIKHENQRKSLTNYDPFRPSQD